ncbi:MAG: hypothetical protein R8L58_04545, partial [Mariprofundaceae bacterium]
DAAREQAMAEQQGGTSWLTWLFGGLMVILLGVVGMLMRREPAHPATASSGQQFDTPETVAAAATADVAAGAAEDDIPEIEVEEADVEALQAEGGEGMDETAQMTVEQQQQFTDSIPDLTDEDTGSMPAFKEEVEEEPDPNVDYLSEADVYMRYGMEEEAMQQVTMALRLKPDNAEAHIKKAELLQTQGNSSAFEETVAEATQTLAGVDLERFNAAISELQGASETDTASGVNLEDTLPPTNVSALIDDEAASTDSGLEEAGTISELDDLGFGDAELDTSGAPEDGMDTVIEPAGVDETAELDAALSDLDNLDLGTEETAPAAEEPAAEAAPAEAAPAEAAPTEEAAASEPEGEATPDTSFEADSTGGLDFDLSDVELPDSSEAAAENEGPQIETADLDKTVAMDWSKDTSVDSDEFDISGESGAEETEFESVDEVPEPAAASEEPAAPVEEPVAEAEPATEAEPAAEPEQEITLGEDTFGMETEAASEAPAAEEPAAEVETTASLDLGEGDLDDGFDVSDAEVEPADDFTSTIRTSLDEVGVDPDDFTATGEHDLQFNVDAAESLDESMLEKVDDESADAEPEAEKKGDDTIDGIALDLEEDTEATLKLDNLLSEFSDEEDDKKD